MNSHGFELLQEVSALLATADDNSGALRAAATPESRSFLAPTSSPANTTHARSMNSMHNNNNTSASQLHSQSVATAETQLFSTTTMGQQQQQQDRHDEGSSGNLLPPRSWADSGEFRDDYYRQQALEETIDETIHGDDKAFAVLDALLTTARHNTDLTELDIVCRRVRQSEMEQLQQGLEVLEAYSHYVKRRCNVLYGEINAVNDQQAMLVRCLEAALQQQATEGPMSSPAMMTSQNGRGLQQQQRGSVQTFGDDNQSSAAGSLRGPASRILTQQALSSSSSQSGGKQLAGAALLRTQSTFSSPHPQQQRQGTSAGGGIVSPYRVLGGPLDRNSMQTLLSTAGGYE
ncbi:Hypothetical protein, putative [Bodo saltans]|uniref:Uncharacterized protein n=1 Tax=Bodo saltans TaxID=75058 RepID=A0A0S4JP38_BODSA|nr:Hypothetical protein, putative [Bodo saltans]|eukprot:CUG92041.1 Hypothetical protein, putative [Bodo saltans]